MKLCPQQTSPAFRVASLSSAPHRLRGASRALCRLVLGLSLALLATQSFAAGTWTTKASMLTARSNFFLAEHNGILYAAGGHRPSATALATLEAYDPATDMWTARASMPTARQDPGGAFLGGILYVVGGHPATGLAMATVEAYDPTTDTWTTKQPMLTARYGASVAVLDGLLYAVGGYTPGGLAASVEAYDPATNTWTPKASMPTARVHSAAAAVGGLVYVFGGESSTPGSYLTTSEAYDPATGSWTTMASLPTTRALAGAAVLDGLVYLAGGQTATGGISVLATVVAYDPATNSWTSQPSMPTARLGLGVAVADGILYAVGGTTTSLNAFVMLEALVPAVNEAPLADAGPDQTLDATIPAGAEVNLDATESLDADGDTLTFLWSVPAGVLLDDATSATPTGTFPVGVHLVTLTASDGHGGLDTDDVMIQVEDAGAPSASCTTDLAALWPPNHRLVDVQVRIVASDLISDPSALVLTSVKVTSDEADDAAGNGDGATTGDVHNADGFTAAVDVTAAFTYDTTTASFVGTVKLRAERAGTGDGRSYGIEAVIQDASGNATSTSCVVVVPHSRGR